MAITHCWRQLARIALASIFLVAATDALAQAYPSRPIRLIVPFPAGGGTDIVARIVANEMSRELGQSVIVENKAGASGIVGADFVSKAPPDGYTIVMSTMGNFAINPAIYPNMPFSVEKNLSPVTNVVSVPLMLIIHPSIPAKTVQEFIAYTTAQPSPVPYSSSGTGGGPHLAGELFIAASGANMMHIPFKGSGPAYAALLGAQVAADFDSVVQGLPYVRNGQLRALAVLNNTRSPLMPDVPSMSETLPGYDVTNWYAMMAPSGTPLAIRQKLQQTVRKVISTPEMKARLIAEGVEPVGDTPDEFGAFLKAQTKLWADVVRKANIKVE